jgi:hypothetical protein
MAGSARNDFANVLAQYIPAHTDFYRNVVQAQKVLASVARKSGTEDENEMIELTERVKTLVTNIEDPVLLGQAIKAMSSEYEHKKIHGITFLVRETVQGSEGSKVDELLIDSRPYNGGRHYVHDEGIEDVVAERRYKDLATVIDGTGYISHANVPLDVPHKEYRTEYGLEGTFEQLLGEEDATDGLGARKLSALCASWVLDSEAIILTLHEPNNDGQQEISAWYRGARIYNSAGRTMRTDMLHFYPLPPGVAIYNNLRAAEEHSEYRATQKPKTDAESVELPLAA